jgi:hypothetical protein
MPNTIYPKFSGGLNGKELFNNEPSPPGHNPSYENRKTKKDVSFS